MPKRSSKDPNVTAFSIMQQATAGKDAQPVADALGDAELRRQIMREMGRRCGQKGGKSRAENLNQKQRTAIAKHAAAMRWKAQKPQN